MSRKGVKMSAAQERSGESNSLSSQGQSRPSELRPEVGCPLGTISFTIYNIYNNNNNSKYLWGSLCQALF